MGILTKLACQLLMAPVTEFAMAPFAPLFAGDHSRPSTSTPVSLTGQPPETVFSWVPTTCSSAGAAIKYVDEIINDNIIRFNVFIFNFINTLLLLFLMIRLR